MIRKLNLALFLIVCAAGAALAQPRAYVTNRDDNTVSVINTSTNPVTAPIPVGSTPLGIAVTPNGARAYVTNAGGDNVSVLYTVTNTVIATLPVGTTPE